MTIREVLDADWTVAWIRVTIRDLQERFVAEYIIGKDVKPYAYCRYQCEAEGGSVYDDGGRKYVFINRTIQHRQLDECTTRERARSVGVLLTEIPAVLLDLKIKHMRPGAQGNRMVCTDTVLRAMYLRGTRCRTNASKDKED